MILRQGTTMVICKGRGVTVAIGCRRSVHGEENNNHGKRKSNLGNWMSDHSDQINEMNDTVIR